MNRISQVKVGALISYVLIIMNVVYGIAVTPFIIASLGMEEYGVYRIIASLSSTMAVLDFGLGGTVQRYVASFNAKHEQVKIPNFVAMSIMIAVGLNLVLVVVAMIVFQLIDPVYSNNLNAQQLTLAKMLFLIMSVNLIITVFENVFNGVISGFNKFVIGNGVKLVSLLLRIVFVFVFLNISAKATTLVLINLCLSCLVILTEIIYINKCLKVHIRLSKFDGFLLREAGIYTLLLFLTSIASQVFSNVDNIIIGAFCKPAVVTVYSIGLQFFGMFQSLSAGIAGVLLPTITNAIVRDQKINTDRTNVINLIIKAGRIQFILLGGALIGFVCIGKDFIYNCLGSGYDDVYIITLILIIPAMFELCINACLAVLRAENKLGFRTCVTFISAIANAIITIILVTKWSYIGAAVATALSYIICSLLAMNIYYVKVFNFPMLVIYKKIIEKTCICLAISGSVLFSVSRVINGSWIAIGIDVVIFGLVYGTSMFFINLDKTARRNFPVIGKLITLKENRK